MPLPYSLDWQHTARADVRQIDRATAIRIFEGILPHSRTGGGDVAPLYGDLAGMFRLRVGDYRDFFRRDVDVMYISAVLHRSQAVIFNILLTRMERFFEINGMNAITKTVVETERETLVIGQV